MVRTRGLRRALGRVLGTQVNGDVDEAPQRQGSTTSTRRQRAATPVAQDVEYVDHAADKVHK